MATEAPKSDAQFLEQFEPDVFWEEHGPKIMGVLLAVVVIGLGIYLWQRHREEQTRIAAERLASANDVATLQAVIQDYPTQDVAAQAALKLADVLFRQTKYSDAAAAYQGFLEQFPSHPLVPTAQLGLASVREAEGNYESAALAYGQLLSMNATGYAAVPAKLGAARCAEALGQKKEARQMYEEAMALAQGSPSHTAAYLRWLVLGRELPKETSATATNAIAPAAPAALPAAQ